jgi:dTDP-D-glucose 4,6-dehydratase
MAVISATGCTSRITARHRAGSERGVVGESYNIGGNNEWNNLAIVELLCERLDARFAAHAGAGARYPRAPQARGESAASLIDLSTDRAGHDWRYAIDAGPHHARTRLRAG